jgi:hypothetical protein
MSEGTGDVRVVVFAFLLSGCTSQFSLGPAAWSTVTPPVIPGFHPVPLGGGGFVEEPDVPTVTAIETVIVGLEQAQKVRTLTRQLAR